MGENIVIDKSTSTFIIIITIFAVFILYPSFFEAFENTTTTPTSVAPTTTTPTVAKTSEPEAALLGQIYANPFDDSMNKDVNKIDTKRCSRNCCKQTQWPVPFNTESVDVDNAKIDYSNIVPNNFSCSGGGTGSGCLCVTKDDMNYLSNHFKN